LKEINAENITFIYLPAVCLFLHLFIHLSKYLLFNFFLSLYLFIANLPPLSAAQSIHHVFVWLVSNKSERMWQDMMAD
jgi:hypothetical protein